MKTCCICGNEVGNDPDELFINGQTVPVCADCGKLLDKLESLTKTDPQRESVYHLLLEKMQSIDAHDEVINTVSEIYQQDGSDVPEPEDDDDGFLESWDHESRFSFASGQDLPYVVMQVTLKEKFWGTGSGNLTDLEEVINAQVAKGYRLHTMSTSNGGSKGFGGGDRIQATLVFERLDMCR